MANAPRSSSTRIATESQHPIANADDTARLPATDTSACANLGSRHPTGPARVTGVRQFPAPLGTLLRSWVQQHPSGDLGASLAQLAQAIYNDRGWQ